KEGAGTVILAAANSYRGTTTVNNGILQVDDAAALGTADRTAATGTVVNRTLTKQATLQLSAAAGITITDEALTLNGAGSGVVGPLANLSGNNVWTGPITLGSAAPNGSDVTIGVDAGTLTLSGQVDEPNGPYNLTKTGAGSLVITGSTHSGAGVAITQG